ncbi:MAG: response regulator [Prochloraceae cyanobacterium]|nr:response regulator [Prochloraceae cyanobacterium]
MNEETRNIAKQLNSLSLERFTGRVDIQSVGQRNWNIFLRLGRIIWGKGGEHPNRSWQRYFNRYCPEIDINSIDIDERETEAFECPNYQILIALFDRKKIDKAQLKAIVKKHTEDVIFDIIQQEEKERIYCEIQPEYDSPVLESALKISFALVNIKATLLTVEEKWEFWKENSLEYYNPNAAPIIRDKYELREEVSEAVYQNFVKFFDGSNTLRDLAVLMDIDINRISFSLLPYIRKGLLDLKQIEDIKLPIATKASQININSSQKIGDRNKQKIICIDDSAQICYIMKQIVTRGGYNFAEINQPLYAIPKIIEEKPDLIFLDLGMPIVNGYEMCSQIRRISYLKDLPIVILTSQDTIVDRVRARIVGATDFISKPLNESKIMNAIDKYLLLQKKKKSNRLEVDSSDKNFTKHSTT